MKEICPTHLQAQLHHSKEVQVTPLPHGLPWYGKLIRFLNKNTESEKKLLDLQFSKMFYACNIPFSEAENEHITKVIYMLRGGSYKPANKKDIAGYLLDDVNRWNYNGVWTGGTKYYFPTRWLVQYPQSTNRRIIEACLHNGNTAFFIRSPNQKRRQNTVVHRQKRKLTTAKTQTNARRVMPSVFYTVQYTCVVHLHLYTHS